MSFQRDRSQTLGKKAIQRFFSHFPNLNHVKRKLSNVHLYAKPFCAVCPGVNFLDYSDISNNPCITCGLCSKWQLTTIISGEENQFENCSLLTSAWINVTQHAFKIYSLRLSSTKSAATRLIHCLRHMQLRAHGGGFLLLGRLVQLACIRKKEGGLYLPTMLS